MMKNQTCREANNEVKSKTNEHKTYRKKYLNGQQCKKESMKSGIKIVYRHNDQSWRSMKKTVIKE